ncbi:hypothetical protein PR202_gb10775 [Eleusine coracana subsp. coracana]|uniref:S-adenosyl-L-methionine-dependent methyltransferase n=1 Tax=Eleusine coracana subsp. coracana TaxID=191504 RepID=A0AAV5ELA9_ELECO|nr:hypothetical protein PR202_gb10775 [Eleusine coracana subsp. coracana]
MSSKVEEEAEACATNGTDDMAKHGGAMPSKEEERKVEACTNGNNTEETAKDDEGEEAAFAAVMAQVAAEGVRALHARVEAEWGPVLQSACQTAAARALWGRAVGDPAAGVLAGERFLRALRDKMRRDERAGAREVHGVMIAVRTLWFDKRIEAAVHALGGDPQVVLLGAGLVPANIQDADWITKLQSCGYVPERNTVWVLEGIIYYLHNAPAMQVLETIAASSTSSSTVLLADFMNKNATSLSPTIYHFYHESPELLLPSIGFSQVTLSQIGDLQAHFGLLSHPENLFEKLRRLPRSTETNPEDGTPCCRLYFVEASASPDD